MDGQRTMAPPLSAGLMTVPGSFCSVHMAVFNGAPRLWVDDFDVEKLDLMEYHMLEMYWRRLPLAG